METIIGGDICFRCGGRCCYGLRNAGSVSTSRSMKTQLGLACAQVEQTLCSEPPCVLPTPGSADRLMPSGHFKWRQRLNRPTGSEPGATSCPRCQVNSQDFASTLAQPK